MSDPILIYSGSNAKPIYDTIKQGGRPFDIGGSTTVNFRMRYAESDDLKVDEDATVEDSENGEVSYQWTDLDLDEPGEYYAWWHLEFSGSSDLDTEEFLIVVTKHSPGLRTQTGAVYLAARSILPITWDALEDDERFGDAQLQRRIEVAKLRVFGTAVAVEDESTYDIRVIDYIAKTVAVSVIPAGMDYWLAQKQVISATGTNESVSYPDRITALEKIHARLVKEIASERDEVEAIVGVGTARPSGAVPEFTDGTDVGYITPLPADNFGDYAFPHNTDLRHRRAVRNTSW